LVPWIFHEAIVLLCGILLHLSTNHSAHSVITDPQHVKAIFYDSDKHIKAVNNNSGWLMGELLGKCVGLISGPDWSRVRERTGKHFTHSAATQQVPLVIKRTTKHIHHLCSTGSLSMKGSTFLDPVQDLKYLPFWIVADLLYGELSQAMQAEMRDLAELREKIWGQMIQGGMTRFSFARYLPWGPAKKLRVFKKRWEAFNRQARDACVQSRQQTPIVDMFAAVDHGTLQLEELLQTCDEMLFANLDVTIGALSWNLVFLATHQDTQDEIRREILANTSNYEDQAKYLQDNATLLSASILESSRLRPLAPFSVPQAAPTERRVGPYLVPAYTNFIIDTYKLNIQHDIWGADGQTYKPSRFLGAKASELRYSFWRFGFGPRQCLGKYIGDVMIRSVLVELLTSWKLEFDGEGKDWAKKEGVWITTPDVVVRCERRY
jgi:cytochrome P450